ncbi:MAG TPA: carboxyl transferase domain-containing protein [Solirubrobacteraceae bacterium]|nr:carboxyl transferase domain-containing protein [Solirubrobacteraceae bacterium]
MSQQRMEWLCDPRSLEPLEPASLPVGREVGVQAAWGRVAGRPVVCYAQDSSIAAGAVGVAEAEVIVRALRHSRSAGVPVVGFLESAGARLQEGAAALGGFGRIFYENVALAGRAPQVSVITGVSAGGGCYSPALTDFVVMTEKSSMFLTGPRIVKLALGEKVTAAALGGTKVHARNGVCDFLAGDDADAIALLRELLDHLPQNASQAPRWAQPEDPAAGDPGEVLPARSRSYYDVRELIARLVDAGRLLEVQERWARNMVVGFARLEGHPVAVIANQARYRGGIIDVQASQKAAKFINTCDAFGIPMLVLADTPGFMPGSREEAAGVIAHGASLLRAFAGARVPRVTVIVRKAFGGAFITMNSKGLGADACFCWPQAEIGIMSAEAAVEIIHARRLLAPRSGDLRGRLARHYARENLSLEAALRGGAVDAVIEPAQTRERVARALGLGEQPTAAAWAGRIERAPLQDAEQLTAGAVMQSSRRANARAS